MPWPPPVHACHSREEFSGVACAASRGTSSTTNRLSAAIQKMEVFTRDSSVKRSQHNIRNAAYRQSWKRKGRESGQRGVENKEGRRARSSRLPFIPLSGNPISLTEG